MGDSKSSVSTNAFLPAALGRCNNLLSDTYDILDQIERCADRLSNVPKDPAKDSSKVHEPSDYFAAMSKFEDGILYLNERLAAVKNRLTDAI